MYVHAFELVIPSGGSFMWVLGIFISTILMHGCKWPWLDKSRYLGFHRKDSWIASGSGFLVSVTNYRHVFSAHYTTIRARRNL